MSARSRSGSADGGDAVPSDSAKLQSSFTQWMQKMSANLDDLGLEKVFIFIDNVDLLIVSRHSSRERVKTVLCATPLTQDCDQVSWVAQPLPKNVRVILTVSEDSNYSDSWRYAWFW